MNYATQDAPTPLGYADDNWLDGTQSGVFSFVSPGIIESGYGLTTTMIHEYGHHSSLAIRTTVTTRRQASPTTRPATTSSPGWATSRTR